MNVLPSARKYMLFLGDAMLFSFCGAFILLIIVYYADKSLSKAHAATCAWCDADDALLEWRLKNPGVYIGLSTVGRTLLGQCIDAYDEFLRTHPFVSDDGYRDFLLSLMNELPPRPRKRKRLHTKPAIVRVFTQIVLHYPLQHPKGSSLRRHGYESVHTLDFQIPTTDRFYLF